MVDMFLDPVMVGAAGREVRRNPRGGAAGLEPRRITGEGRGRDRKFAGGREKKERRQQRGLVLRVPRSAEWGEANRQLNDKSVGCGWGPAPGRGEGAGGAGLRAGGPVRTARRRGKVQALPLGPLSVFRDLRKPAGWLPTRVRARAPWPFTR